MKLVKRAVSLLLATAMTMTVFVGCAKEEPVVLDPNEVVMVVGETEVKMNIANFFVRYNQSLMESIYEQYIGEYAWITEMKEGVTYEDNLKEALLEDLKKLFILNGHVADYDVTLTDAETKSIEAAAESFISENKDKDAQEKVSGDKDTVIQYLKLYTLSEKLTKAMRDDVDANVSEAEATQKRVRYYEIKKSVKSDDGSSGKMTDKEIKEAKKEAEEFLKGAKANGSMETYAKEQKENTKTLTFNANSTALDKEVIQAADALGEKEFSEVIESENGIYVLQLESLFDEEATETEKETILTQRQNDRYEELLEKWTKDTKVTVHEEVWDKISIQGLKIVYIEDPKEDKTEK